MDRKRYGGCGVITKIVKVSDDNFKEIREIKNIDELLNLRKEFKSSIIVEDIKEDDCDLTILIFDDYL